MHTNKFTALIILLVIITAIAFITDVLLGSVNIPLNKTLSILFHQTEDPIWSRIIFDFRLPKAITAALVGSGLSIAGLQMQTLFRNPLAGPYMLGISSGASLGVAIVVLSTGILGTRLHLLGSVSKISTVLAAIVGAGFMLMIIVLLSRKIKNNITLLILGLMFSHIAGAFEEVLQYFAEAKKLQGFVIWNLGNFSTVAWEEVLILSLLVLTGLIISFCLSKPLNALLLGENYAMSMGINTSNSRLLIILVTGILAGSITAFCGPIAFLGVAVPHLTRGLFNTSDHLKLIPLVCLVGAIVTLCCDIISQLPKYVLPINVVTSLIGGPVVIWVIIKQYKTKSSFAS